MTFIPINWDNDYYRVKPSIDDSNKKDKDKEKDTFKTKEEPIIVGKCPKCAYGKLVIYFGVMKYCNVCDYKE